MKYDAICLDCTHTYDYISRMDDRDIVPPCPCCASSAVRRVILHAPTGCVTGKFQPFKSQLDGSIITNNRELQEHNKRNNVALLGDGYSNDDILAGRCGKLEPDKPDPKDIAKDVVEAIRKCEAGYKPKIDNEGAEL